MSSLEAETVRELRERAQGSGLRVGIVAARYNDMLVRHMIDGAHEALLDAGVKDDDIVLVRVPGAFELPAAARRLADTGQLHAIVALGVVLRGETYHFEVVADACAQGLQQVALQGKVGIGFGVLTVDTVEQGLARAGLKQNKGQEAALTALEMARLLTTI